MHPYVAVQCSGYSAMIVSIFRYIYDIYAICLLFLLFENVSVENLFKFNVPFCYK